MSKPKFAVFGNPISHSKSPFIHQQFAQQMGIEIEYLPILVKDDLRSALLDFRLRGGIGANITLPFKEEAFQISDLAHSPALKANAANTVWWNQENALIVSNTDGIGFIRDLCKNNKFSIKNKTILIIGAGGATSGILPSIIDFEPKIVHIANRTIAKAENLVNFVKQSSTSGCNIQELSLESLSTSIESYHLIINATSAGLINKDSITLNPKIANQDTVAYDLIYGKNTFLTNWAKTNKIKYHDGLGMLVEQAAESFFLWHNFSPRTSEVINLLLNDN